METDNRCSICLSGLVVSVFGSGIVAIIGIIILTKNFADFDYDEEAAEE